MAPAVSAQGLSQRSPWWARLVLLSVLGGAVALAGWQWRRAVDKDAAFARMQAQRTLPPLVLQRGAGVDALAWRRVELRGVARDDATIWLDNSFNGRDSGYRVLTPVLLVDGRAVLLERGWLARRDAAVPLPPLGAAGGVAVSGVAMPPPGRRLTLSAETRDGKVWQMLDLPALSRAYRLDLLPLLVVADQATAPLRPAVADSDSGAGRHRAYALQWLLLGLAALVVYRAAGARRSKT